MAKKEVSTELRWSLHLPAGKSREDTHLVKEAVTYDDGTVEPKIRYLTNVRRPVYVTADAYRNHKDKKEFEDKDKLTVKMSTQTDMIRTAAQMLGKGYLGDNERAVKEEPYVYGIDITSTSLLKLRSLKQNNMRQSPYSVSVFDIETDMWNESVLMASFVMDDVIHTAVVNSFVKNYPNADKLVREAMVKYLPEYTNIPLNLTFHETEIDLVEHIFKVANEVGPDFLAIWNMDFDIPRILDRLDKAGVDPRDVLCDQRTPKNLRTCYYREGIKSKKTFSGKHKPINPSLQWHTLVSTSSFYVIDAMCTYRQLRMGKAEEVNYKLDTILKKELDIQKLKFEEADGLDEGAWHEFMQENYPIEYIVYNIFDCLSVLQLEKKTSDLSSALPTFAGITDFSRFGTSIAKNTNSVFLHGLSEGKIIGTVSKTAYDEPEIVPDDEDDDYDDPRNYNTLGLSGWIQFLPQNQLIHDGLRCLEDFPEAVTNIRGVTFDADSTSSYPSCTIVANVSKATCVNEIISIEGIEEIVFTEQNLSIAIGTANMLEYGNVMFDLPSMDRVDFEIGLAMSELGIAT